MKLLSDSPAPGGGSVAALMGALGVSLGGMVANLSVGQTRLGQPGQYFSGWAVKAQQLKDELLFLVDEDTAAFNKVMDAFGLPKDSVEEKTARSAAIQEGVQIRCRDSVPSDANFVQILRASREMAKG